MTSNAFVGYAPDYGNRSLFRVSGLLYPVCVVKNAGCQKFGEMSDGEEPEGVGPILCTGADDGALSDGANSCIGLE